MKLTKLALLVAVISMTALSAAAEMGDIWNTGSVLANQYNWLMHRNVSSSWGTIDALGNTIPATIAPGYGTVGGVQTSLSSAQRTWIPYGGPNGTNNGTVSYYGMINLGAVRPIEYLSVATYHEDGMWYDKALVQFSNDPSFSSYQQYTLYDDPGNRVTGNKHFPIRMKLDQVYNAQYVRVVFPTGHYGIKNNGDRGGPGLLGIEPYSPMNTDIVVDNNFNLAFNAFTGKNQVGAGFNFGNGSQLGDGIMVNNNSYRSGASNPWSAGTHLTVELNDTYWVDAVRIVWNDGSWWTNGMTLQFSLTGKDNDWNSIPSVTVLKSDPAGAAMLGNDWMPAYITFEPRQAKFVRWVNATGTQPGHTIAQQFLVYGQIVPEPATMTLLVLGGLAMLRRKRT